MNNKIRLLIRGKNPNYFLKEIIHRRINLYDVSQKRKELEVTIDYRDYKAIKQMKTSYKIKIIKRYGINHWQEIIKQNRFLILFTVIGIIVNIILSKLIFQIEMIHPNENLKSTIQKDLEELGVKKYHWKKNYEERKKIKELILEKEKDSLEWLEIEEEGTKYKIVLEERKQKKEEIICPERNVIAKKNAIIMEIKASEGEIVKKTKDYVTKGDLIISGFIHNKETVVSKKCAKGTIYGETWYKVIVNVPQKITEEKLKKQKSLGFFLKIGKREWNFQNKYKDYQKVEYNIIRKTILPFSIGIAKYQKVEKKQIVYTEAEIEKIALELAEKTLNKNLQYSEKVLEKKVLKKEENDSKIKVEILVKVKEDITDYEDITGINIEDINNKEE